MKFASLRAEIRHIADNSKDPLLATAIFARVTRKHVALDTFHVTLGLMVMDKQMERHGDKKPFKYSSGPEPVDTTKEYRPERSRLKGNREMLREEEARERGLA
jgi:hypothetical protein